MKKAFSFISFLTVLAVVTAVTVFLFCPATTFINEGIAMVSAPPCHQVGPQTQPLSTQSDNCLDFHSSILHGLMSAIPMADSAAFVALVWLSLIAVAVRIVGKIFYKQFDLLPSRWRRETVWRSWLRTSKYFAWLSLLRIFPIVYQA